MIRTIYHHLASNRGIEEHVQKVLVVVMADTVGDPGTMMVHLQDTLITLTAVVTSIRFSS